MKRLRDRYNKRRMGEPFILDAMTRDNGKAMYRRNDGCFEVIHIQHSVGDVAYEYYPHYDSEGTHLFVFDNAGKALEFYSNFNVGHIPTEKELLGEEEYDSNDDYISDSNGEFGDPSNRAFVGLSDGVGFTITDNSPPEVVNRATLDELQQYVTDRFDPARAAEALAAVIRESELSLAEISGAINQPNSLDES